MDIASIGSRAVAFPQAAQVQESEAAERVPDNEAAEATVKAVAAKAGSGSQAPLPSYAGTVVDTQA